MVRVGAYPGTFDPPTVAHLAVAEAALTQGGLDEVHLVLSRSPLGKAPTVPSFDDRVEVLEAVAATRPWLGVRVTDHRLVVDLATGYDAVIMGLDKWLQVLDPLWYGGSTEARDRAVAGLPPVLLAPRTGPGRAAAGRPGEPGAARPGEPGAARPGEPGAGSPGEPGAGSPGEPGAGSPGGYSVAGAGAGLHRLHRLEMHPDHGPVSSTLVRAGRVEWMLPEAAAFDARTGAWTDPERYRRAHGGAPTAPFYPASLPPMHDPGRHHG